MYDYNRRRKIGPATILFLFLFSASIVGLSVISYLDRGRSWDMLPYFCIPIIVLSLVFAIYNLVRRCNAGFIFILFFIIFTIGLVLSSVYGPFALRGKAIDSIEEKDYSTAIEQYGSILKNYPNSRYAKEALQRISFAYYDFNQFPEALGSFREAMEKDVIDPDSLEVLDVLQDIYFHIALEQEVNKEYLKAANNYLDSLEILKVIRSDFSDTNEAFIARYKIPEYLFKASENFNKYGDTASRVGLLEEIIAEHPESDYYQDALEDINDAYIGRAIELSGDSEYEDAVNWFLKFLRNNPGPQKDILPDYKINKIFEGMEPSILWKSADTSFRQEDLDAAAFLYGILISFYPDYLENVLDNLVTSKILLAQNMLYDEILQSITGKYINSPELSLLMIINNTGSMLTAYIKGPQNYMAVIPAGEASEVEMIPAEYTVLVESGEMDIGPFMGTLLFEEYRKYTETFDMAEEEEDS